MSGFLLFASTFLASAVEMVEAATIVLAAGVTRGWRSSLVGALAALLALAVIVIILGPAIASIPLNALRLIVGSIGIVFGMQWLRKAILRASGFKALRDEAALYEKELREAGNQTGAAKLSIDPYGFTLSFKGVLLEGLEVAFIIVTFGAAAHNILLAVTGATLALISVLIVAVAVHRPLSNVPENTLKFSVGLMLVSFGSFWSGEGIGVDWPGSDASILGLLVFYTIVSLLLVQVLQRRRLTGVAHVAA